MSPSAKPVEKVQAAGVAGALTVLVVFIAAELGVNASAEAASAFTTLVSFAAGYFTKPR